MKRLIAAFAAILILLSLTVPVSATERAHVIDEAGLFSSSEILSLEDAIAAFSLEYGMDVVILTVDNLGGRPIATYADSYYDQNGYGIGSDGSGLLFLLAMEEREWYISTCGQANIAFPDSAIDDMADWVIPYLSDGAYYDGFSLWIELLPTFIVSYQDVSPGNNETNHNRTGFDGRNLLISLAVGLVVAGIVILIMRATMNTARRQSSAKEYLRQGSYHLTVRHDMFLYSHVSKTAKPKNTGSSGGSRSHGGRGGSF